MLRLSNGGFDRLLCFCPRAGGPAGTLIHMAVPDHSRNYRARSGYRLHDAFELSGYERQSIWGWDVGMGGFFAQLWRNDSASDEPELWLVPGRNPYQWPGSIALAIVEHTKLDPLSIVRALAIAHPKPALRRDRVIRQRLAELNELRDSGGYVRGQIHALIWTLGMADSTPGTRVACAAVRPTPPEVDAEHHIVTGRIYSGGTPGDGRDFFHGADEALWWALRR